MEAPATATHSRDPAGVFTQARSVTCTRPLLPAPSSASHAATVTRLHGSARGPAAGSNRCKPALVPAITADDAAGSAANAYTPWPRSPG